MTRDIRNNLIVSTLAISLAVHFGAMFWVKPRVMTHVAPGIARMVRRGPMRVTDAATRPDPVAIEVLKDETAKRDAPPADETVAILPSDEAALPGEPVRTVPPDVAMPEVLSALTPEVAAPRVDATVPVVVPPSPVAPKMTFEKPQMVGVTAPSVGLSVPDGMAVVPTFEAPVFAPVGSFKEQVVKLDRPADPDKQAFKPPEEVMPAVDEQVVKAERDAIRDLIDSASVLDMHAAVDMSLAIHRAAECTYFRATVRPKPRLPCVPKDVVILIDASGSIGNARLNSCRKAAREILRTAMNTGDRFNLVAFRDRFDYAFKTWRSCDAGGYTAGDRWMSQLAAHGYTDVFATIASVLTLPRDPKRPLVALVVTDGEANTGVSETSEILSKFAALNDGLVSVYMYGVKSSANRELIDMLTRSNRGESFVYTGGRSHAGDEIGNFSRRFRDPVITDLRVTFPSFCAAEAYPVLLRNLYRDNSVELIGRLDGHPREIAFSLRGIAGALAYDGFFRLPTSAARPDKTLPGAWRADRDLNARLRSK